MPLNRKRAAIRAFWASLGRLIGVALGAGAGSLIHDLVGGGFNGWTVALIMSLISFGLLLLTEYERELG